MYVLFSLYIIFTGCCVAKVLRMFKFMNVACVSKSSFYRHARSYINPIIIKLWKEDQEQLLDSLSDKAAEGVRPDIEVTTWWSHHERELPNWAAACRKVLLMQPSSAASERVFSLLENSFHANQARAMEDYIEASLMLQYNKR